MSLYEEDIRAYNEDLLNHIYVNNEKGVFSLNEILLTVKKTLNDLQTSNIIKHLFIYGSYIRNEANKDSDIDICLIYNSSKISELQINLYVDNICDSLLDKYGIIINILCFKEEYYLKYKKSSPLFFNILKEGMAC